VATVVHDVASSPLPTAAHTQLMNIDHALHKQQVRANYLFGNDSLNLRYVCVLLSCLAWLGVLLAFYILCAYV
jgi:hypothetical protein